MPARSRARGEHRWECGCGDRRCRRTHGADFFNLLDEKLRDVPLLDDCFVAVNRDRVEAALR